MSTTKPAHTAEQLAIDGGPKARTRPEPPMFPGGLEIGAEEAAAAQRVIDSKRLIRFYGPDDPDDPGTSEVDEFEKAFAKRIGTQYALGVTSCTASLITGLAALGVGPGDEVIVPAYTFVASPSAVLAVGGIPIITEVDDSLTLDPESIRDNISPYTKAVMSVHMRGMPCEMDEITRIAREHDLAIIEDVAQASGAAYRGAALGSIGQVGGFSLQMHKIITTGEGGVLTTDDPELLFRAKCFHDSASEWRGAAWQDPNPEVRDSFRAFPGMNFRMSEITGALGSVQLGKLDDLLSRMRTHKSELRRVVADLGRVELRRQTDDAEAGTHLVFFTETPAIASSVRDALVAEGVNAMVLFVEHELDWHVYVWWRDILAKRSWNDHGYPFSAAKREINYSPEMCPRSVDLLSRAVLINVPPQLTEQDVDETGTALRKVISALC